MQLNDEELRVEDYDFGDGDANVDTAPIHQALTLVKVGRNDMNKRQEQYIK